MWKLGGEAAAGAAGQLGRGGRRLIMWQNDQLAVSPPSAALSRNQCHLQLPVLWRIRAAVPAPRDCDSGAADWQQRCRRRAHKPSVAHSPNEMALTLSRKAAAGLARQLLPAASCAAKAITHESQTLQPAGESGKRASRGWVVHAAAAASRRSAPPPRLFVTTCRLLGSCRKGLQCLAVEERNMPACMEFLRMHARHAARPVTTDALCTSGRRRAAARHGQDEPQRGHQHLHT